MKSLEKLIFVYQNDSNDVRFESSSGGLFSSLAEKVIADSGVVFGAGFNSDWTVEHDFVTDLQGLHKLRKSKYVFSDLKGSLKKVKEFLCEGRKVLFTGTPCQIAALKQYLRKDYENLLCVEVVCHGAPQKAAWMHYLDELLLKLHRSKQDISNIDFRDKTTGWDSYSFTISFHDGTYFTEKASENIFMRLFLSDYILKKGCFHCPFKQPASKADITMGDLWGMKQLLPDSYDNLGTSLVIANTEKGATALSGHNMLGHLNLTDVAKYNPAIISSLAKPTDYDRFNQRLKDGRSIFRLGNSLFSMSLQYRIMRKLRSITSRLAEYGE